MAKRIKTGGRVKGTPNRSTAELKTFLKSILCSEIEKIPDYLTQLDTRERLEIIIKLLPFVVPKETETKLNIEQQPRINLPIIKIERD